MKQSILLILIFYFTSIFTHATNLVFNGNFELPGFTIPAYFRYLYDGDSTTMQGWTVSNDGIGEASYLMHKDGYGSGVYEGNYTLSLNQGSSIRTTFATEVNQGYLLSFFVSISANPQATPLKVRIGDIVTTFSQSGIQTYNFVATSTNASTILEFINDAPAVDFKIHTLDVISIVQIPEATSVLSLISGIVVILFLRRNPKK